MTVAAPAPPNVLSPGHVENPWPGLAVLREHYPVYWDEAMGVWLVSRYDDIKPLLRGLGPGQSFQELAGQYKSDSTSFMAMDGLEHRKWRSLLGPFFARSGVDKIRYRIERTARALLEPIFERERAAVARGERDRGEMDFIEEFSSRFSVHVMMEMLDLSMLDEQRVNQWLDAWLAVEGNIAREPAIIERGFWAKGDFAEVIVPVIAERQRNNEGDDLLSYACRAEIDGAPASVEDLKQLAGGMLAGGITVDHQLGALMYELIRHPEVQRTLAGDRSRMEAVLAEGMRYCSIVQYAARIAGENLVIDGVEIEAGAPFALMTAAGNHDPRRWQHPDMFDIDRDDHDTSKAFAGAAEHLGFGGGAHFCIGAHLSKAEMEIALNVFLDSARDIRLVDGWEPQARPDSPFVRALDGLKITFDLT